MPNKEFLKGLFSGGLCVLIIQGMQIIETALIDIRLSYRDKHKKD